MNVTPIYGWTKKEKKVLHKTITLYSRNSNITNINYIYNKYIFIYALK